MSTTNIQLAQPVVPPSLQTRLDRISGVRPGAINRPLLRGSEVNHDN